MWFPESSAVSPDFTFIQAHEFTFADPGAYLLFSFSSNLVELLFLLSKE